MTTWEILERASAVESGLNAKGVLARIDETAMKNQAKVMESFRRNKVSDSHFAGTTGYG